MSCLWITVSKYLFSAKVFRKIKVQKTEETWTSTASISPTMSSSSAGSIKDSSVLQKKFKYFSSTRWKSKTQKRHKTKTKDENTKNTWWQKWYELRKLHEWHKWHKWLNDMNDKNYLNNKKRNKWQKWHNDKNDIMTKMA